MRNTLRIAGNSITSSERPSPEPLLKTRGVPSRTEGERILEMVLRHQIIELYGLGVSSRTLEGKSRKSSESVSALLSGIFLEFLPESPSRTGRGERKIFGVLEGFGMLKRTKERKHRGGA